VAAIAFAGADDDSVFAPATAPKEESPVNDEEEDATSPPGEGLT